MQSLNEAIFLGAFAAKVENYTDWHRQAPSVRMKQPWALQTEGLWNSMSINPMTIVQKVSLNCVDFESLVIPPITKFSFCVSAVALFFPRHSWGLYHMVPCDWSPRRCVIANFGTSSTSFQCGCQDVAWALATDDNRSAAEGTSLNHLHIYRYASLNNGVTFIEMRR